MINKIKKIRIKAKKEKQKDIVIATGIILGEIQRGSNKNIDEDSIYKIIDKLINEERDMLSLKKQKTSNYLNELVKFQKPKLSDEEMVNYFSKIDFSKLKVKMQAIKMIKEEYGSDNIDGNKAKEIIMSKF